MYFYLLYVFIFFANWVLIKEGDKVHKSRNLRRSGTDASRIKTHHLRRPRDKTKGKGKLELWFLVRPLEIYKDKWILIGHSEMELFLLKVEWCGFSQNGMRCLCLIIGINVSMVTKLYRLVYRSSHKTLVATLNVTGRTALSWPALDVSRTFHLWRHFDTTRR